MKKRTNKPAVITAPPINVAVPNTSRQKMEAIVELSRAIKHLSTALCSTNIDVSIIGNHVHGPTDIGINVTTTNDDLT